MTTTCKTSAFVLIFYFIFQIAALAEQPEGYQHSVDSIETLIKGYLAVDSLKPAINALGEITDIYEYEGKWDEYDQTVERMFELAESLGDKEEVISCYNKLGIASNLNGRMKEALNYFEQTLILAEEIKDTFLMANAYENIGVTHKDLGNYQVALEHQMKSATLRENRFQSRLPNNYSNISVLFEYLGDSEKQYFYLKKALEVDATLPPNSSRSAILCCEMGEYLMKKEEYDSCLVYFQRGLKHSKDIQWHRAEAVFLGDIAEAYKHMGNISMAVATHRESLRLSKELNDCSGTVQEYNFLSELFLLENEVDSAQIYNEFALKLANECDLANEILPSLELASRINERQGAYKKALDFHKQYLVLHDSLTNIERQEKVAELETQYQTTQKEQQIALLSAENKLKNERIWLFVFVIIAMALAIGLGIIDFMRRKKRAERKQESLRQQLLRSQMNPHFLFNALGSIQNFMYNNEPRKAAGYLGNFASLTRSILENSTKEYISLADEIETLRNYLELEQLRTNNKFEYEIANEEASDAEFIYIPPMMIQPFVENAIKHGFKEMKEGGQLNIKMDIGDDVLHVEIRDNGIGINNAKTNKLKGHNSMSMKIFEERRALMSRGTRKKVVLDITDMALSDTKEQGTLVKMSLPIQNQ